MNLVGKYLRHTGMSPIAQKLCFVLFTVPALSVRDEVQQPNIVLILADDLEWDYKQDRLAIMPNLRKLREEGAHLVNHVAAQPVCGPSRSSLVRIRAWMVE